MHRRGRRHRQHLLGDRDRRPGRAPDDPPHRARESRRAHRRDRLLRDALRGRSRRRCPTSCASCATTTKLDLVRILDVAAVAPERLARAIGDGDGPCGAAIEPGVAGRTAFTLRVQTGCEERCAYCIIPIDARRVAQPADRRRRARGRARRGRRLQGDRAHRRAPRLVRTRPVADASSLLDLLRALDAHRRRRHVPRSARSSRWTARRRSSISSRRSGRFTPHFHLPLQHASDRMLRAMRRPVHARRLPAAASTASSTRLPHASIGSDMIVGFPGRDRRGLRREPRLPAVVAADAPARVPVFRSSRHRGVGDARQGARIGRPRSRAAGLREIGAALTARFHDAQAGTVRPGLTLEDGTLVVTDNYLKVRIPPGLPRNERVIVRLDQSTATARRLVLDRTTSGLDAASAREPLRRRLLLASTR